MKLAIPMGETENKASEQTIKLLQAKMTYFRQGSQVKAS